MTVQRLTPEAVAELRELSARMNALLSGTGPVLGCAQPNAPPAPSRYETIHRIARACARACDVTVEDIHSSVTTSNIVLARHMTWWIARRLTRLSYPEIGRVFGGRDHTTVMHGVKRFKDRRETDRELRDWSDALLASLQPPSAGDE